MPGQGAFGVFMRGLVERGLGEALREAIASGRPYLGICLGLQILFDESEEQGPRRRPRRHPRPRDRRLRPRRPGAQGPAHRLEPRASSARADPLLAGDRRRRARLLRALVSRGARRSRRCVALDADARHPDHRGDPQGQPVRLPVPPREEPGRRARDPARTSSRPHEAVPRDRSARRQGRPPRGRRPRPRDGVPRRPRRARRDARARRRRPAARRRSRRRVRRAAAARAGRARSSPRRRSRSRSAAASAIAPRSRACSRSAPRSSCSAPPRCATPALVEELCRAYPGQIIVAVDARDGIVAVDGWTDERRRHRDRARPARRGVGRGGAALHRHRARRSAPRAERRRDLGARARGERAR